MQQIVCLKGVDLRFCSQRDANVVEPVEQRAAFERVDLEGNVLARWRNDDLPFEINREVPRDIAN